MKEERLHHSLDFLFDICYNQGAIDISKYPMQPPVPAGGFLFPVQAGIHSREYLPYAFYILPG